jgi:hypothetical protein
MNNNNQKNRIDQRFEHPVGGLTESIDAVNPFFFGRKGWNVAHGPILRRTEGFGNCLEMIFSYQQGQEERESIFHYI